MAFRTILTITGPELGNGDLSLAAGLCKEVGAHLSVLVMAIAAPPPVGEYAAMVSDVWLEQRREDLEELTRRTDSVSSFLAADPLPSDVSSDYQEMAWADDVIGRRGRYADLTVVGPELLSGETLKDKILEGALFSSGKPVLLVPRGSRPTLRPKRVMVAWDTGFEASRAVAASIELLAAADQVRVVLVDPETSEREHGAEPGADIAAYLARHGAKVMVDRLPSQGQSTSTVLRRHATDSAAELLVMGGYGHSRLRERVFGGVTHSMIETPALPTLMAR